MGQSLRRMARRPPPQPRIKNVERPVNGADRPPASGPEEVMKRVGNEGGVLEERDPGFDAMLNEMVGRINSKPGGKLEMGEAFIVEKYNRPMPKLRNTKSTPGWDVEKPVPAGTLNVAQLRQILFLHQGKSEDHQGPMDIPDIAKKFKLTANEVQQILKFLSLPPEDGKKNTQQ
ncbi:hypothetical protein QJS10_CPA16g01484 [Acorus calamus]|uniref:Uncharacterized protein n=1 Tax=Acorus calamus TaxID=4465 RepID=A0AAV9CZ46_ACOCL|nr:hypothetical protein QJS10_CPA16g01484 [Acorus calamus]